jgi:hypothetical protein
MACSPSSSTVARRQDASQTQDTPPARVSEQSPPLVLKASIRELMDAEVDPAADYLWASVASISTKAGLEERQPRTEEAWHEVRRHAVTLVEATNLLIMKGRRVSDVPPGRERRGAGFCRGAAEDRSQLGHVRRDRTDPS